jgi:hypothetical protein
MATYRITRRVDEYVEIEADDEGIALAEAVSEFTADEWERTVAHESTWSVREL